MKNVDIINEIKKVHDRLENINIEIRDLRNILRGIIKKIRSDESEKSL